MMKKISFLFLVLLLPLSMSAQRRGVSILGDSYSTYRGFVLPDTNYVWYPRDSVQHNDVMNVRQTWWHQFLRKGNFRLCQNNSFSGATICHTGYNGDDYSDRSFVTRVPFLGSPDIIIVFGGTNDSWAKSPIGNFQYEGWTRDDLYSSRPAMAHKLSSLQHHSPGVDIYVVINTDLSAEVTTSMKTISDHYGIRWIQLHDIDKQWGHPSQLGMRQIADQLTQIIQ